MKRWSMIAIAFGSFAVTLVVTAPATLVDGALQRATQGRLRLAEAQGTLWSGSGQVEIRDTVGLTGVTKSITWRVKPASLLRGHLLCEVALEQSQKHFPVTMSLSRIDVENADITLPASVLALGVPKLAPLGLTGEVLIHVARMSLARDTVEGNATLQWRAAGSMLTTVSPLGDYEVRLDGEGQMVHAYLRTIEGPLALEGEGSWKRGANPVFQAMARVPEQQRQELAPLLRLIAVQRDEGRFELQLN